MGRSALDPDHTGTARPPGTGSGGRTRAIGRTRGWLDQFYGAEAGTDFRRVWQVSKQWLIEQEIVVP